jgi:thioredoxin-related protein
MQISNIKAIKCNFEDNERNIIFKDLKGETLFKLPGEIDGEMF